MDLVAIRLNMLALAGFSTCAEMQAEVNRIVRVSQLGSVCLHRCRSDGTERSVSTGKVMAWRGLSP